jgi:hypothetical protein
MNRFVPAFAALSLLICPAFAQDAQVTVPKALLRAIHLSAKQHYIGTRVVEFRKDGQQVRYREIVSRDGPLLRIEFPGDSPYKGQLIVETSTERRHFLPDKNEIRIQPPRREDSLARLVRIASKRDKFTISTGSDASVAGLPTTQIVVSDKSGNVLQRLFISKGGIVLRRQMLDPVGTVVGGFEFEKIDLTPKFAAGSFELERRGVKMIRPEDSLRDLATANGFPVAYLRPSTGVSLQFSRLTKFGDKRVLMQFYAQQGARLSMYQVQADVSPAELSKFARDLNIYSWQSHGNTFVLVGSQDAADLRKLSNEVFFGNRA